MAASQARRLESPRKVQFIDTRPVHAAGQGVRPGSGCCAPGPRCTMRVDSLPHWGPTAI